MPFSRKTLTRLAEGMEQAFSHAELSTLFYEHGVEAADPGEGAANKLRRSLRFIQTIEASKPAADADEIIRDISNAVLANEYRRQQLTGLVASLGVDGFEWAGNHLVPSNPGPAPLAPELTALEQEIIQLGLNVAATHYRQAVENFADGNFEASNGQLRSFLEDLIKGAALRRGQQQEASPDTALEYLRNGGVLDGQEFGMFRALWHGTQDNGPHAGLTDAEEARFRMHSVTAAGRYLVKKIV